MHALASQFRGLGQHFRSGVQECLVVGLHSGTKRSLVESIVTDRQFFIRDEVRLEPAAQFILAQGAIVGTFLEVDNWILVGDGAVRPPGDQDTVQSSEDLFVGNLHSLQRRGREQMVILAGCSLDVIVATLARAPSAGSSAPHRNCSARSPRPMIVFRFGQSTWSIISLLGIG